MLSGRNSKKSASQDFSIAVKPKSKAIHFNFRRETQEALALALPKTPSVNGKDPFLIELGQPAGSAIYFGVDVDAAAAQIQSRALPFFRAVTSAFAEQDGLSTYKVGVYGSGATCRSVWMPDWPRSHGWRSQRAGLNTKPS